jgi:uncharacterized protein YqjF (DUF2071 family)
MSWPRQHDFNYGILDETAHRPWAMPPGPWVMTQTWHNLMFAHWPVDSAALREKIPAGFELDRFEGQAWVGIVPFLMTNVAPRGVPALPWLSAFPELNVRTYVRVGGVPGVYFFSLDAANPIAVGVARVAVHLPYFTAKMRCDEREGTIECESRRASASAPRAEFRGNYRAVGAVRPAERGTLEYFLTERHCLFTVKPSGAASRVDIHHPPWPLQGCEATISTNTMADAAGIRLPDVAPLLHFSKRQDMVAWLPAPPALEGAEAREEAEEFTTEETKKAK